VNRASARGGVFLGGLLRFTAGAGFGEGGAMATDADDAVGHAREQTEQGLILVAHSHPGADEFAGVVDEKLRHVFRQAADFGIVLGLLNGGVAEEMIPGICLGKLVRFLMRCDSEYDAMMLYDRMSEEMRAGYVKLEIETKPRVETEFG